MSATISQPAARTGQPGWVAAALAGLVALTGVGIVASQVIKPEAPVVTPGGHPQARPLHLSPADRARIQAQQNQVKGTYVPSIIVGSDATDRTRPLFESPEDKIRMRAGELKVVIPEAPAVMDPTDKQSLPGRPGAR